MTRRGKAVVNLGRKSVTVTEDDGAWGGTWSNVTQSTAADAIAVDGWRLTGPFEISPHDNGAVAPVERHS